MLHESIEDGVDMSTNQDIRWKQRFQSFSRAFMLLREALERGPGARNLLSHTYDKAVFDKAVDAIHARYLPALAAAHAWLSGRMAE